MKHLLAAGGCSIFKPHSVTRIDLSWDVRALYENGSTSRLPDQLERRGGDLPPIKHRGFTHSCFLIFLILLFSGLLCSGVPFLLATQHFVLTDFWAKELSAVFLAVVLAFVLHIAADCLTTRGVKVMWPDTTSYGMSLFSNATPGEYFVLWGYIFLTGALVALGILGF